MTEHSRFVDPRFFARHVDDVAEDIVGRRLFVRHADNAVAGIIVEAEAYGGPDDPASHAAFKPNGKAKVMWEAPGTVYVYAAYGVYPCLNFVTGSCGEASAVLIRGIWIDGQAKPVLGPGRTTRVLGVTLDDHATPWDSERFRLSERRLPVSLDITPRIGITRGVDARRRYVANFASLSETILKCRSDA